MCFFFRALWGFVGLLGSKQGVFRQFGSLVELLYGKDNYFEGVAWDRLCSQASKTTLHPQPVP